MVEKAKLNNDAPIEDGFYYCTKCKGHHSEGSKIYDKHIEFRGEPPKLNRQESDLLKAHAEYIKDEDLRKEYVDKITKLATEEGYDLKSRERNGRSVAICLVKDGKTHGITGCKRNGHILTMYKTPRTEAF